MRGVNRVDEVDIVDDTPIGQLDERGALFDNHRMGEIVDELRFETAKKHIREGHLSFAELAVLLGAPGRVVPTDAPFVIKPSESLSIAGTFTQVGRVCLSVFLY